MSGVRDGESNGRQPWLFPFVAGVLTAGAGFVLTQKLANLRRRVFDPSLIPHTSDDPHIPPAVVIPGIMGSGLTAAGRNAASGSTSATRSATST